jgi:hypothetical protein
MPAKPAAAPAGAAAPRKAMQPSPLDAAQVRAG